MGMTIRVALAALALALAVLGPLAAQSASVTSATGRPPTSASPA